MKARERILSIKMIERKKMRQEYLKEIGVTATLRTQKKNKEELGRTKEA